MYVVKLEHISKRYNDKEIIKDFSLEINQGEFVVIMGKSGSGKSTLLNIIGLLSKADYGDVYIFNHKNVVPYSRKAESLLKDKIGYLFQNYALIDDETVYDNLSIVLKKKDYNKIEDVLKKVGLAQYSNRYVYSLSGGEQQRVAIARLLLKSCELVLADEPTGSLDYDNKKEVCQLLKQMNQEGKTIIVVTHDNYFMEFADKVIYLNNQNNE
jgi:putative ABC transport system ATP-binding protein